MSDVVEMATDQAPRLFGVVLEYGEQTDAQVYAWGMALDDFAYMTTVDGSAQFALEEPENALRYVPRRTNITPHLIWITPAASPEDE
ncbi:hypothetical protein ALI144C_40130 [Actinosynnema sp. ALI-1.44]|uniref:hypothetical protein n=1 Tax=Actinosynnema sp. ALI-1.44 TaxID=1933779 RepID=UPI00097C09F6|nr:hypothetical protein [Actinosynnema sp. ALI-1.44]ONI74984.1 hypothetical protein ALI144C_40130 [Actinosynnema sp. ALI-1.44]